MRNFRLTLMVLAVASMTAFYSCGPAAEDQANAEEVAADLEATLNDALDEAAEAPVEEVATEEEVVTDSTVVAEEVATEEVATEEAPAE